MWIRLSRHILYKKVMDAQIQSQVQSCSRQVESIQVGRFTYAIHDVWSRAHGPQVVLKIHDEDGNIVAESEISLEDYRAFVDKMMRGRFECERSEVVRKSTPGAFQGTWKD